MTPAAPGDPARAADRDAARCDLVAAAVEKFGALRIKVHGASMLPAIWPGDILSVERIHAFSLLPSDVIVFRRGSRLFAHRFVALAAAGDRARVLTAGDALDEPDLPVPIEDVIGRACRIERGPFRLDPRTAAGPVWRLLLCAISASRALRNIGAATVRGLARPLPLDVR